MMRMSRRFAADRVGIRSVLILFVAIAISPARTVKAQVCAGMPPSRTSLSVAGVAAEGLQGVAVGAGATTSAGVWGDVQAGYTIEEIGSSVLGAARIGFDAPLGRWSSFCPMIAAQEIGRASCRERV